MTDKEIMQQAKEIEALKIELESANSEYKRMSAEAGGKIGELKADAERYRGLRRFVVELSVGNDTLSGLVRDVTELDAAIAQQKEPT
jgi:hypothetical protein